MTGKADPLLAAEDETTDDLERVATELGRGLAARGMTIATAESCTAGGIARALTETAGSSEWFDCGFVTYSNDAKQRLLGVRADDLATHGAVSDAVARAMAIGAVQRSVATVAVSVTGIAGPGGGSPGKPVGTVWFGFARRNRVEGQPEAIECSAECMHIDGDRRTVRLRTALHALRRAAIIWL
ncbi:MAG: CinA family protein [Burkholderiaceae bacterium]